MKLRDMRYEMFFSKLKFLRFLFIILTSLCLTTQICSAQEEEKKNTCPPPENKKAISLYEKGSNKKKYEKPERLKYLQEALQLEPNYAEAAMFLGNEIIVKCKLDNLPFSKALPYF